MPSSGVESLRVIRMITECEVVIILSCFNILSSRINVVISSVLCVTIEVSHCDKVAIPYMYVAQRQVYIIRAIEVDK